MSASRANGLSPSVTNWISLSLAGLSKSLKRAWEQEAAKLLRASRKDRKARLYMPLFILLGIYTGQVQGGDPVVPLAPG